MTTKVYKYRCRKGFRGKCCDTRRTLPKPVEEYTRIPRCRTCGAELCYLDKTQHRLNRENKCECDGYDYPHRVGSLRCNRYDGPRDLEHEQFNEELGASEIIVFDDEVPF